MTGQTDKIRVGPRHDVKRPRRRKLQDTSELRKLWCSGHSMQAIADAVGVSRGTLHNFALEHGYGSLAAARHHKRVECHETPPVDQLPPPAPPSRPEGEPVHPYWTPELDQLVLDTAGACRAVTALAAELGKSTTYVWQRWHRLRVEVVDV